MLIWKALFATLVAASATIASPAAAVTFFSLGGSPDPGTSNFETTLVTFDGPHAPGVIQTTTGMVGLFSGTHSSIAAAPAGDTSHYLAIGPGGSALFDFRPYFANQRRRVRSFSVYVGSVDLYNFIDVLDNNLGTLKTIGGVDLPGNNGDQFVATTNRRLYINFLPSENVGGLRFRSDGVAFEFDNIAVSSAVFARSGPTPLGLPTASVPEASTWVMLIAGFGLTGFAARRRRVCHVTA